VLTGTFSINDTPVKTLFDSRAGVGGGWRLKASWLASRGVLTFRLVEFRWFENYKLRRYDENFGL
jgi:hypothetical protein